LTRTTSIAKQSDFKNKHYLIRLKGFYFVGSGFLAAIIGLVKMFDKGEHLVKPLSGGG